QHAERLIRAELVPEAGGETIGAAGSSSAPTARDATLLRFGKVSAGRYTLHVRLTGDEVPLAIVDGIDVDDGPVADPRLWSIDVRGRLRPARLRLVDGDGELVRARGELAIHDEPTGRATTLRIHDGELLLAVASHPVHATVQLPGWR